MICRGSANTATVGSEIARIWPLRSVIMARCASAVASTGFGAAQQRRDRPLRPVRRQRLEDRRVGKLADHREEQQAETERRIDQPVARLLQRARGAAGRAAVTRTVSMRGTASPRAAPRRCAGRAARRGVRRGRVAHRLAPPPPLLTHCEALTGIGRGGGTDAPRAMPSAEPVRRHRPVRRRPARERCRRRSAASQDRRRARRLRPPRQPDAVAASATAGRGGGLRSAGAAIGRVAGGGARSPSPRQRRTAAMARRRRRRRRRPAPSARGACATGTAARLGCGSGAAAQAAAAPRGSRLSRSAMLVNWPGVTVFR